MAERSKQRIDADNAFLRLQTRASVNSRILSETELANQARDAKTARLKAQRLDKEAHDRAGSVSRLPKSKPASG